VVVLAGDDHESVRPSEEFSETLKDLRCLAFVIFLVHAVEEGEVQLERIDHRRLAPSAFKITSDEASGLHSLAVGADRAQDDWHKERHLILCFLKWLAQCARPS
jgi:hypothetical protein